MKILWKIYASSGSALIKNYFRFCTYEVFGQELEDKLLKERKDVLIAGWHRGFLIYANFFKDRKGSAILSSRSDDGELMALVANKMGYHVIRGSSTRGGTPALVNLIRHVRQGHQAGLTPDGPVGPPYISKHGIFQLVSKTGSPLLPVACDAEPSLEFNSWDRAIFPLPFSRIVFVYGREPVYVPKKLHDCTFDEIADDFDLKLNRLTWQTRYYVKNKLKGIDPRDIVVPDDFMKDLPLRKKKIKT